MAKYMLRSLLFFPSGYDPRNVMCDANRTFHHFDFPTSRFCLLPLSFLPLTTRPLPRPVCVLSLLPLAPMLASLVSPSPIPVRTYDFIKQRALRPRHSATTLASRSRARAPPHARKALRDGGWRRRASILDGACAWRSRQVGCVRGCKGKCRSKNASHDCFFRAE